MKGYVHSQESFGTVDGPGIRYVVFVQGCPMRCQYCHNPDTWTPAIGQMMDTDEILAAYERNRVYYQNGGLTVIHTCLDTSGITFQPDNPTRMEAFDRLMQSTDLVMLDIKHIDPEKHRILTGQPNDGILAFARYLSDQKIPIWIRHVVVPGITDDAESLYRLGYFIGGLRTLRALDVLPYHTMGIAKYEQLGIDYPLQGVPPMDKARVPELRAEIIRGVKQRRAELRSSFCN